MTKQVLLSTESSEVRQKEEEQSRRELLKREEARYGREKILNWLSHPDASEYHNIASSMRVSTGTGRWFLDGTDFQNFKENTTSILWLHGASGCGKSILCSAIIDELQALRAKRPQNLLAYWYFSVNDSKRRSLQNLARTLICQLMPSDQAPPVIEALWESKGQGRDAPKTSDLVQVLRPFLEQIFAKEETLNGFVVIDALDECDEAELGEIMRLLRELATSQEDQLHILVTSRTNTTGVEKGLGDATQLRKVAIDVQHADIDIKIHVTECLQYDKDLNKWSEALQTMIRDTLVGNAAGMFRWVDCQLQAIRQCRTPRELKKVLGSLPQSLQNTYAKELAAVDERAAEDVRRILEWLTFPWRPYVY